MKDLNLNSIEEKYQKVKAFLETLGKISQEFNAEEGITEEYFGPFNQVHELSNLIEKLRSDIIGYSVQKLNSKFCPNIPINASEIEKLLTEKFGELGFSAKFIYSHIQDNFVINSDQLSLKEILIKAKDLLPILWAKHGRRDATLEDILEGRKLILRAYMDSYPREGLTAIEKLIKITLDNENPSTVTANGISSVYRQLRGDEFYRIRELNDSNVEKVRAYKNHKFLIYFKDEEKAMKVAKVLLKKEKNS